MNSQLFNYSYYVILTICEDCSINLQPTYTVNIQYTQYYIPYFGIQCINTERKMWVEMCHILSILYVWKWVNF